jgi:hypothetical protein
MPENQQPHRFVDVGFRDALPNLQLQRRLGFRNPSNPKLFPFDRPRWLGRDVIHHAVYTFDFIDDPVRDDL